MADEFWGDYEHIAEVKSKYLTSDGGDEQINELLRQGWILLGFTMQCENYPSSVLWVLGRTKGEEG